MKRKKFNNRGVTLVELVIALAVLSMLLVAVIMMMSNNSVIYRKTKADINVQTVAQETFNTLQDSIMQAKEIFIVVPNGSKKMVYMKDSYVDWHQKEKKDGTKIEDSELKEIGASISAKTKDTVNSLYAEYNTVQRFSDLKKSDGTYVSIEPVRIIINYSVGDNGSLDNNNCTVNYYFCKYSEKDEQKVNLYVTREYDFSGKSADKWATSVKGPNDWTPLDGDGSKSEDRDVFKDYLYTSSLREAKMTVDYSTQSVNLMLDFYDRGMKYETSGIVSVRNSYVMKEMRNRLALDEK